MVKDAKARIFLSYAHEDLNTVRKIDAGLMARNLEVWFDKRCIKPGPWKRQIEKAIPKCRYFVICISHAALKKTGYAPGFQDDELQQAYEIARIQPEDAFTILPIRLEDCDRGDHRLSPYQQYDLFNDFEAELDHLAVNLGGISLSDNLAEDTRSQKEKIISSLMGRADTACYARDFQKAIDVYTSIALLTPDYAKTRIKEGIALASLGRNREAIVAFEKALEIAPEDIDAWINKGVALNELGQNEEALAAYDKALKVEPNHTLALISKGVALFTLGRNEEAIETYDKALEIEPDFAGAWNNKGSALADLGRNEEALAAYDKALKIEPDDVDIWNMKGVVLYTLGRIEEAIEAYDKVLEIEPENGDAWNMKWAALYVLGRNKEAIEAYVKAQQIKQNQNA